MAAPTKDPNLAALDPLVRDMRKAEVRETMQDASRVLLGQTRPPAPDYTDQRIKLIGMLGELSQMETDLRAEQEKTGRVRLSTQATALAAIARLRGVNTEAMSAQQVARINALDTEMRAVERQIEEKGSRNVEALPKPAFDTLKELGRYVVNGKVPAGNATAFTLGVAKGIREAQGTGADAELPAVFMAAILEEYGVNAEDFIRNPGSPAVSAEIQKVTPILAAAGAQATRNAAVAAELEARGEEARREIAKSYGLSDIGTVLGRDVLAFEKAAGRSATEGTSASAEVLTPPALTAKPAEKQAFFDRALGVGAVRVSDDGNAVTITKPDGTSAEYSYAMAVKPIEGGVSGGLKVTSYIDAQMDHVLKELDRLETGTDPDSVRLRKMVLASPELATWAKQNDYEGFSPELQLKALIPAVRKMRQEERAAFRAKFDTDMMAGEGGALGKAVASVRDFLRPDDKKVGPAARRQREDSADMTNGAKGPDAKTENTGATESDPKKWNEETDASRADGLYPPIAPKKWEGVFSEEARAEQEAASATKTQKTAAESAAHPERTLPADTNFDRGLMRGRNEREVQRVLNNADPTKFGDIAKQYEAIQSFKTTDPEAYTTALAGLAAQVKLRSRPTDPLVAAGSPTFGTEEEAAPIPGMGKKGFEMPDDAKAKARAEYAAAQAAGEQTRVIPRGVRGTMTGPDQSMIDDFNASLPPIDETDAPEPPTEGPVDEGVDTMPQQPDTVLADADAEIPADPVAQAETDTAGSSALSPDRRERIKKLIESGATPASPGPDAGSAQASASAAPTSTTPTFDGFGAKEATLAAGQAMSSYLTAEEQLRARRRAALGLGPALA